MVRLGEPALGEPLTNVFPLVSLELEDLAVLRMLNHRPVTRKLLQPKAKESFSIITQFGASSTVHLDKILNFSR